MPTAEACALRHAQPVDAEGFISFACPGLQTSCDGGALASQAPFSVLALTRFGRGHVIAWCDSTNLDQLLKKFDVTEYLGGRANPRVAGLGPGWPCAYGSFSNAPAPYLGKELPAKYVDGAALAADWDAIILCGMAGGSTTGVRAEWAPMLQEFVRDQGKGLLAVMDYGDDSAAAPWFDSMNAIVQPTGITFRPVNLGWSTMTVDAECVPDLR